MRVRLLLLGLLLGLIALLPAAVHAAVPGAGTVSQATPTSSWTGGPFLTSNPSGLCLAVDPSCDTYALTIAPPATGNYTVEITTTPSSEGDDYDLYVNGPSRRHASAARRRPAATRRSSSRTRPRAPTASARWPGSSRPAAPIRARRRSPSQRLRRPPTPAASSIPYDPSAAQATVEVPLRVVAVGFAPGELDEAKVLGQIPNFQRPGVLIPRGQDSQRRPVPALRRRDARQPRAQLLQRHEAVHRPVRVHVEAAARSTPRRAFTQGLFNGDEGQLDHRRLRQVREPPVPRGLQRDPRRLPRHRRARRAEHAGPLHRRREDRGLDRGQLEGACSAGTTRRAARARAAIPATPSTS